MLKVSAEPLTKNWHHRHEQVKIMDYKKSKWGTAQKWGVLKVKYLPTGEIKEIPLGIKRMGYHNELIFCEAWGYDKGHPTDLNHPDNYEVISVEPYKTTSEMPIPDKAVSADTDNSNNGAEKP